MAITFLPLNSYPQNLETGFPVGQSFYLIFSNRVDLDTLKESCVLFGRDFDRTSGPNNSLWLNTSDATNPFFLRSPNFPGFVECDFEEIAIDSPESKTALEEQRISKQVLEQATLISMTPKQVLGEYSEYYLYIIGENVDTATGELPDFVSEYAKSKALSIKSVYSVLKEDTFEDRIKSKGSFEPKNNEQQTYLNIKIIEAGEGSQAKYIWWFADELEPTPSNPNYKHRVSRCVQRWRATDRGVLLRFDGSLYEVGETFKVYCYEKEYLQESFLIKFKTTSDSVYTHPSNVSSSPIGVFGEDFLPGVDETTPANKDALKVISVSPYDGAVNVSLNTKRIVIEFNKELDASTFTQENIELFSYPVSGSFDGPPGTRSDRERKLYKIINVNQNKLILEI